MVPKAAINEETGRTPAPPATDARYEVALELYHRRQQNNISILVAICGGALMAAGSALTSTTQLPIVGTCVIVGGAVTEMFGMIQYVATV